MTTPQGRILRLDEVATIRSDLGPGIIRRENVGRVAMLTEDARRRTSWVLRTE